MRQCYLDLLSHCGVMPRLSRQAIGLRGLSLSNDQKSFVQEEKFVFPPHSFSLLFRMQSNGQARIIFADCLLSRCIVIYWIPMRSYLTRLQDRNGKPKSLTMAPTIYPRLPSAMKRIRTKQRFGFHVKANKHAPLSGP